LDAGDFLFRSEAAPSEEAIANARLLLDFYRDMGYTALCIGRRDLAGSTMFLVEETGKRGLRPLSSNLRYKGEAVFEPYAIFEVNSVKVGVLAVTSPDLSQRIKADGIEVLDPSARLKSLVPELKNRVDVIVLLSNLGELKNRKLAGTVDGIDLIIGSGSGRQTYKPLKTDKTYVLRTHPKGRSVGQVDVELDAKEGILDLDSNLVMLNAELPEDKTAAQRIQELEKRYPGKKTVTSRPHPADNPFLKALEEAKKRKGQKVHTNATVPDPFTELLKKRSKAVDSPSKSNPFSQKPASEVKEPE
jgi:2',3'-cyclic-nucleotide 2'-phosphodiesterase (5'-nucleotidase family)